MVYSKHAYGKFIRLQIGTKYQIADSKYFHRTVRILHQVFNFLCPWGGAVDLICNSTQVFLAAEYST